MNLVSSMNVNKWRKCCITGPYCIDEGFPLACGARAEDKQLRTGATYHCFQSFHKIGSKLVVGQRWTHIKQ